jgi:hypothetical protein
MSFGNAGILPTLYWCVCVVLYTLTFDASGRIAKLL